MYTHLAPNLTSWIHDVWLLWFQKSNRYTILDSGNYSILKLFFTAENKSDFLKSLSFNKNFSLSESEAIFKDLETFITDISIEEIEEVEHNFEFDNQKKIISKTYSVYNTTIQINFDSEIVMRLIHLGLEHLSTESSVTPNSIFDIYIEDNLLCLFFNHKFIKSFPKKSYHLLQGKFIMQLLCSLYKKEEKDWLGLFHASTISNKKDAIMCIANSGKGKSTLASLLMANGYELITDDVSPILSTDKHIYSYPGAISIKEGSFKALSPLIDNFDDLPSYFINNSKNCVKYVPPIQSEIKKNYPCKTIVLVNYFKNTKTSLEKMKIEDALDVLISDSWISPEIKNVQNFMDWLGQVTFYKLNYSSSEEALEEFSTLFD